MRFPSRLREGLGKGAAQRTYHPPLPPPAIAGGGFDYPANFSRQPSPATVSPAGRYSQPTQPP